MHTVHGISGKHFMGNSGKFWKYRLILLIMKEIMKFPAYIFLSYMYVLEE